MQVLIAFFSTLRDSWRSGEGSLRLQLIQDRHTTKGTHQLAQLLLLDAFTFALSQLLVQNFCAAAAVCCTLALALLVGL